MRGSLVFWLCADAAIWRRGILVAGTLALLAFGGTHTGPSLAQTPGPPPQLLEPFEITVQAKRLSLPEPFSVTVRATRLKLPEPFTITVQARRLTLPEPFAVTVQAKRLTLPEPFAITVRAKRLNLPEPFTVTVQAKHLALPEPFTITVEAKRLKLPDPFTITIEAKRENCGADAEKQLAAATALIGRNALGAAETTLDGIDRNACPRLVPRIEAEKARITQIVDALIAELDAAARTCSRDALAAIFAKLAAAEHPRLAAPRSRAAQLQTTIASAEEAYKRASEQYGAGDFTAAIESYGHARALLDGAGGACPELGQRIASGLDKARRTRDAIERIDTALRSCDGRSMSALLKEVKTIFDPHPLLSEKIAQLEKVAPLLTRFDTAFERAQQLYDKGDLVPAKSELRRLDAELEALGGQPDCPALRDKVKTLIQNITRLEDDLKAADDAIRRCDPNLIDLLATQFRRDTYHRLIRAKIPELDRAKNRCIVSQAEADAKACKIEALNLWRDTALTEDTATLKRLRDIVGKALPRCQLGQDDAACRAKYGDPSYALPPAPKLADRCTCKAGYVLHPAKARCVTPAEIMADSQEKCREKYGENAFAIRHLGKGEIECGCKAGFGWNAERTACSVGPLSPDAICVHEFGDGSRALRQRPDGRWDCKCSANTKFDAKRRRCVPFTGADGNAACRKKYGRASYATRYAGNGVWDCFIPQRIPQIVVPQIPVPNYIPPPARQPRCHARRDGQPGLHCE